MASENYPHPHAEEQLLWLAPLPARYWKNGRLFFCAGIRWLRTCLVSLIARWKCEWGYASLPTMSASSVSRGGVKIPLRICPYRTKIDSHKQTHMLLQQDLHDSPGQVYGYISIGFCKSMKL